MSKHTPGPWTLGKGLYTVREQGTTGAYGFIARTHLPGEIRSRDEEEQQANARLIAAAPELLEACQRLLDAYNGTSIPEVDLSMENAERVIAQATGKEPS